MTLRSITLLLNLIPSLAIGAIWPEPAAIETFITNMHERHGFERSALVKLFEPIQPDARVLKAMEPPTETKPRSWENYRAQFLNKRRIDGGTRFWKSHQETLKQAENQFGVPAKIIVAIIGVETDYGANSGNFNILESLATLAFAYPRRGQYFRGELEAFLLLSRENQWDPASMKGSFAGALGIPQFMPSSLQNYAIDFDGNGFIDLSGSPQDAIGSVGRFLNLHGWQTGQPITEPLQVKLKEAEKLIETGIKPILRKTDLSAQGISLEYLPSFEPTALIDLATPEQETEFWWGFNNFYVITRYNRSSFYAMSVVQLADAIAQTIQPDTEERIQLSVGLNDQHEK